MSCFYLMVCLFDIFLQLFLEMDSGALQIHLEPYQTSMMELLRKDS